MNPLLARSSLQAARMAVPRQAVSQQARNVHFENKVYNVRVLPEPRRRGRLVFPSAPLDSSDSLSHASS